MRDLLESAIELRTKKLPQDLRTQAANHTHQQTAEHIQRPVNAQIDARDQAIAIAMPIRTTPDQTRCQNRKASAKVKITVP